VAVGTGIDSADRIVFFLPHTVLRFALPYAVCSEPIAAVRDVKPGEILQIPDKSLPAFLASASVDTIRELHTPWT